MFAPIEILRSKQQASETDGKYLFDVKIVQPVFQVQQEREGVKFALFNLIIILYYYIIFYRSHVAVEKTFLKHSTNSNFKMVTISRFIKHDSWNLLVVINQIELSSESAALLSFAEFYIEFLAYCLAVTLLFWFAHTAIIISDKVSG